MPSPDFYSNKEATGLGLGPVVWLAPAAGSQAYYKPRDSNRKRGGRAPPGLSLANHEPDPDHLPSPRAAAEPVRTIHAFEGNPGTDPGHDSQLSGLPSQCCVWGRGPDGSSPRHPLRSTLPPSLLLRAAVTSAPRSRSNLQMTSWPFSAAFIMAVLPSLFLKSTCTREPELQAGNVAPQHRGAAGSSRLAIGPRLPIPVLWLEPGTGSRVYLKAWESITHYACTPNWNCETTRGRSCSAYLAPLVVGPDAHLNPEWDCRAHLTLTCHP